MKIKKMRVTLTPHQLAYSVGLDAANRQMRKEGRTKWNKSDRDLAASEYHRVYSQQGADHATV